MVDFAPRFTISNRIAAGLTTIERARGFLDAATLSDEWVRRMSQRALLVEAHATTHIEGTELTLAQAEQAWAGQQVPEARTDDVRELLNYRRAFELVSEYLGSGEPITEGLIREIHQRLVAYDRDRLRFYRAIQSVREQDMDLTGWLEFFVDGLATQRGAARDKLALELATNSRHNLRHLPSTG